MKYLVTGATGFVGGVVARQLRDAGHEVVAIARDPARAGQLMAIGVDVRPGDITDRASLREPMTGVDGVFHIAGWYQVGVRDASDAVRINVDGTRNVLETMRELGIPRGVYTSTLAINSDTHGQMVDETYRYDGPHLSEYDRTKWVAHHEIAEPMMAEGFPLTIVMPGAIYGPGDTSATGQLFREYLDGKLKMLPGGTAVCWGHVEDTANAHLLAMNRGEPGETYIVAGPAHTFVDAFRHAERITGIPAPRLVLPPAALNATSRLMGLVERAIAIPETYSSEYLRVAAGVTYLGDNSKARRELGFAPRSLPDGLKETLEAEMAATRSGGHR